MELGLDLKEQLLELRREQGGVASHVSKTIDRFLRPDIKIWGDFNPDGSLQEGARMIKHGETAYDRLAIYSLEDGRTRMERVISEGCLGGEKTQVNLAAHDNQQIDGFNAFRS